MLVLMMNIRKVLMAVRHRFMTMPVHMLSNRVQAILVHVSMVFVMFVLVAVFKCLVHMFMFMRFSQMQPHANAHEYTGNQQS